MKTVIAMPTAAQPRDAQPRDAEPDTGSPMPPAHEASVSAAPAGPGRSHRSAHRAQAAAPQAHGPFVPLLLGGLALAGWLGFQAAQLLADREGLLAAHLAQQQTVDSAARLRGSLDALAADTQRMALAGNPSAKLLVDELGKRGVTISATAAAATPTAPAAPAPTGR
ncbi:hypothetical protein [Ideonella sp. A 288]|uniref:hypothetical protein n=1 Tax=Ideonella sp. A 288 TaxID=1962181 RepID=UPI000B4ACA32|nr:hypothetical protein [Ideonella sp. A 288]